MSYKNFISSMSEEQRLAALETNDPVMIIAGAGSGKTRTLIGRFIHLVTPADQGGLEADPSSVMMVTFTNKAAREMRERLHPVLEEYRAMNPEKIIKDPWIGTFHGLSLRILRIESERAGLSRNFSIFDEADARSVAEDVAEVLDLDSFDVDDFFRDLELAKSRLLSAELLNSKNAAISSKLVSGQTLTTTDKTWQKILSKFRTKDFLKAYSAYQTSLKDQNAVDFSDLMNTVTEIFRKNPQVRDSWRSTFRHFMVDEVQDINRAQAVWLQMFTDGGRAMQIEPHVGNNSYASAEDGMHEINGYRVRMFPRPTVAFVGDDDQSIYAFRGSDITLMQSMEERYEGLQVRYLNASYRCQPGILNTADAIIKKNTGRFPKSIRPADPDRAPYRVMIDKHWSPKFEIQSLRAEASRYLSAGKNPSEYAVLVRTRELARVVAKEFRAAGLPVVEGKASDIRKSSEVKDALSFAGFIVNPDAEVLLRRIINKPSRGLGPTSLARVSRNAKQKNISFIDELRSVMNDRVDLPEGAEPYKPAFVKSAKDFGRLIVSMRQSVKSAENAGEALIAILEETDYLPKLREAAMRSSGVLRIHHMKSMRPKEFLSEIIKFTENQSSEGKLSSEELNGLVPSSLEDLADKAGSLSETARRIGNLSILIDQASQYKTLEEFIQEATLEMDSAEAQAGFRIMTIHASKGLEFDRVRLPFWNDGIMPHSRGSDENEDDLSEERRLAYVALTRARESALISSSNSFQNTPFIRQKFAKPSPFIRDILNAGGYHIAEREVRSEYHPCYKTSGDFLDLLPSGQPVSKEFLGQSRRSGSSAGPAEHHDTRRNFISEIKALQKNGNLHAVEKDKSSTHLEL